MFDDKNTAALRAQRHRLMHEVDQVETGEIVCIHRIYIQMLNRLHMVDLEITRRERQPARSLEYAAK